MKDQDKIIEALPESFESEEEAGEFWDNHSLMDYEEHLKTDNDTIEISERGFDDIQ